MLYSAQRTNVFNFPFFCLVFSNLFSNLSSRSDFCVVFQVGKEMETFARSFVKACWFLCYGSRMKLSSVRSFIISNISSFALLIGRTIFFHCDNLSFMLLIGYNWNQSGGMETVYEQSKINKCDIFRSACA